MQTRFAVHETCCVGSAGPSRPALCAVMPRQAVQLGLLLLVCGIIEGHSCCWRIDCDELALNIRDLRQAWSALNVLSG